MPHTMTDGKQVFLTRVSEGVSGTASLNMNGIPKVTIADKFACRAKAATSTLFFIIYSSSAHSFSVEGILRKFGLSGIF